MEVALPAGLYGMAVAEPAVLDRELDGNFMYLVEIIRVQFMLALNYFVTGLFLFQIWKMNQASFVSECSGKLLLLELGCVFLFEVRMLVDIRKAFSIMSLLWAAPLPESAALTKATSGRTSFGHRYKSARAKEPTTGAVLARESCVEESMLLRMYRQVRRSPDPSHATWKLDGLSRAYRVWCMLTVGLPVLVLCLVLAYLGGVYIMRSSDDAEMMMNTLSVVFVSEIEEFLYVAFTSDAMRYNLENMQPIDIGLTNRQRLAQWFTSSIVCPILTVCTAGLLVGHTRQLDCQEQLWSLRLLLDSALEFEARS